MRGHHRERISRAQARAAACGVAGVLATFAFLALIPTSAFAAPPEAPTLAVEPLVHSTEATLKGVLNPGKAPGSGPYELGEYQYLYNTDGSCTGGSAVPTPPGMSLGEGDEVLPSETLTGLTVGAKYTVCLSFKTAGGTTLSLPVTFTAAAAPIVLSESDPLVAYSNADLAAQINPNYQETKYEFEYATQGTTGVGGTLKGTIVKVPGAVIPAGSEEKPAGPVSLGGALTAGTPYFYRVVASNAAGTADGPVETFTTLTASAPAPSAGPAPGWTIESYAAPTSFSAGDNAGCSTAGQEPKCDRYEVTARNAGEKATDGSGVVLSDTVPAGLTVREVRLSVQPQPGTASPLSASDCTTTPSASTTLVECAVPLTIAPDEELKLEVFVTVSDPAARPLVNKATVEGGSAPAASTEASNQVGEPVSFGFTDVGAFASAPNGTRDTQAGAHPYEETFTLGLNTDFRIGPSNSLNVEAVQDVRDIVTDLPVGFVGSILAAPQCTFAELTTHVSAGESGCPRDTIIGHLLTEPGTTVTAIDGPIYNMTPEKGFPAEFAYVDNTGAPHAFYTRVVPTPKGYVLQAINPEIPQVQIHSIVATFYGDPAEHDKEGNAKIPFFTNPTDCAGEEPTATLYADSWQNPAKFNPDGTPVNLEESQWAKMESKSPAVTGCNALQFTPELQTTPTTREADTPSGMEVGIKVPQYETQGVPATPTLKDASVTFPEGFTLDPSAGDGLEACSEAQIGWLGLNGPKGASEPLPNKGLTNFTASEPRCPAGSKVGSLELTTPLVSGTLHGEMYLAAQNENPYGSEIGLYVVVQDPVTGVLIKIAGRTESNPQTGRITGVFEENPNLPFDELKLSFFGGPRAEFATPNGCGTVTTTSGLEPWSAPDSGLPASPFSSFEIDTGCVGGFSPAFTGSNTNLQAGAYSPFVASFSREDTDQELGGLTVSLPPGLLADVGSVPLCGEAQANNGSCPESTQVGTVLAEAGPGPNPLPDNGKVYLTGPYNGGPYGLSVVVPAVAGPFNFGLVIVRQSLRVDPTDAHVTDVSDAFPTMLHATGAGGETIGIPIRLRRVEVAINRPSFAFNPTNCTKTQVGGAITSTQGQSSALATPFQVTNCASLKFTPKFAVTTNAKTSKAFGASLTAKLTEPNEVQGSQANIAKVKVELPKQLPSRLTTLQKACTAAQFNANPANCPKESKIGFATVHTPILGAPLTGPVIFVSHGGEAFPSLTMVLQGDGVTIDLVGATYISKAGVTSTTFKTVPDTPFSTFELTLPTGKFSALTALGNVCTESLAMPTEFIAQNGAAIHESTNIGVTGCKKLTPAQVRAQKLKAALAACRSKDKKNKSKRQTCEKAAKKKFGPLEKAKKSKGKK